MFLLRFLRVAKFNVDRAFQLLENCYLAPKRYPQFSNINEGDANKFFATGCCYPLIERDEEGRRIVLVQSRKLDPDKFTAHDLIKFIACVLAVLLEEEETQIAGCIIIIDHTNVSIRHLGTTSDFSDQVNFSLERMVVRHKALYVTNLPAFGRFLWDFFKSFLSNKLTKRVHLLKHDELKDYINPALLPTHYGGTRTEDEMVEAFLQLVAERKENVTKFLDFNIDWSKVPKEKLWPKGEEEIVGSFRKLEVD